MKNDLCIQGILSYLPIDDLATVSRGNHVLKINADIVFKTVHSAAIKVEYDTENVSQQQMIFRQFGSLATKVEVNMPIKEKEEDNSDDDSEDDSEDEFVDIYHDDGNKVLRTIGHFCGSNLKDLTLRHMNIDLSSSDFTSKERVEVQRMLAALSKLTLMVVCIKIPFLQWARSLQELVIHSGCLMQTLPEITTLPQLKIFRIGACPTRSLVLSNNFSKFLRMNPSIEELDYHLTDLIFDGHLASICSLPKLTHLKLILLGCYDEDLSVIATARKLKKLTVYTLPSNHRQISKLRNMLPTGCKFSIENFGAFHNHG